MKIVIRTQYCENYGAHAWNGEGECPQYWKNKGGSEYIVTGVPTWMVTDGERALEDLVAAAIRLFDCSYYNDYSTSGVEDWSIEEDSYVPYDERMQLEYSGKVTYFAKTLPFSKVRAAA